MDSTDSSPEISVVILCYRAEDIVPSFVALMKDTLEKRGLSYELVLVANYHANANPPDRTPEIAHDLTRLDPSLTVVAKPKAGMMGWDMRSGLSAARGRTIAVIDGDGQMPTSDVVAVYDGLRSGAFDMAKTYRTVRHDGVIRLIVSRAYNILLKLFFPSVRVRDANSKPKIFTRQALDRMRLTADDWFIDAEIVIQAAKLGFRTKEVATVFYRNPRRSSFIRPTAVLEFVRNLVSYRLKKLWR